MSCPACSDFFAVAFYGQPHLIVPDILLCITAGNRHCINDLLEVYTAMASAASLTVYSIYLWGCEYLILADPKQRLIWVMAHMKRKLS